ncbi:MAG: hypothetical protein FJZ61_00830 [Chlamydiae bacterium]|nr:hypothetical protein [Chlamydiota bacterium]
MNKIFCYLNLIVITTNAFLFSKSVTNQVREDGFGSQYLHLLLTFAYADLHNIEYRYTPMEYVEHNIGNDLNFIENLEKFIGFKKHLPLSDRQSKKLKSYNSIYKKMDRFVTSNALKKSRDFFYEGKCKEQFLDPAFFNVVIHVRRWSKDDKMEVYEPRKFGSYDEWNLLFIKDLSKRRFSKPVKFHIISTGNRQELVDIYGDNNIEYHLGSSLEQDFGAMVFSDILIMAPSAMSYTAGLLSKNRVIWLPFLKELPAGNWIPFDVDISKSDPAIVKSTLDEFFKNFI